MGDIVKLALRLFIFALVASVLLAVTNEVTKGPIEQQKLASKMAALNTVLPGCEYEQIEYEGISDDSALDEIFIGKNADGSIKGYALTANPQGYGGEIPITLGVSEGGYVTQVYVGSLQETQGLGSRVGDNAFKEQFIAIAADPDTLRNDVDTIAGATISSSAFVNAVQEMLTYTKGTLGIEPHAGDKDAILAEAAAINGGDEGEDAPVETTTNTYDVTGFAAFKVDVTVDSNGKIVSVSVPENNETPGFGADLIADQSVFDALVGQDIATAQIDVKSGVTLTSNAINDALKQAASAGESGEGSAKAYDVTGFAPFKVEIALDDAGKITAVSFDIAQNKVGFDATGALTGELTGEHPTKKELGDGYGMKAASGIGKEWFEQAEALEDWCVGKTVEEVVTMPTYDKGDGRHTQVPDDVDLKTGCTIDMGSFLGALQEAADNAK